MPRHLCLSESAARIFLQRRNLSFAVNFSNRLLSHKTIDLDYKESKRTDGYGNRFKYRAKVKDTRDAQLGRWAWDVFLVSAQ